MKVEGIKRKLHAAQSINVFNIEEQLLKLNDWFSLKIVKKEFNPDGFNIGVNVNDAAGQTVSHVHIHLIPRYKGDVKEPEGGVRGVIPEKKKY